MARVELLYAIALRESTQLHVESILADIIVDTPAQAPPMIERPDKAKLLNALDPPIERNPGHAFRMGKMAPWPAHLPNPFIGKFPDFFEVL
jgi:hypothetical protein